MTKRNAFKFFQRRKRERDDVSLDDPIFDASNNDDPNASLLGVNNGGSAASINSDSNSNNDSNNNTEQQQEEEDDETICKPWYKRCKCTKNQSTQQQSQPKTLGEKWNAFTQKYRIPILIFTIAIIWPFGIYSLGKFTNSTDSTFKPSDDSPSGKAVNVYHRAYVEEKESGGGGGHGRRKGRSGDIPIGDPMNPPVVIVLDAIDKTTPSGVDITWQSSNPFDNDGFNRTLVGNQRHASLTDGWSPKYHTAKSFALDLESYLLSHPPFLEASQQSPQTQPLITVQSYYSLMNASLPVLAHAMSTHDGQTTTIVVSYAIPAKWAWTSRTSRKYEADILSSLQKYGSRSEKKQQSYFKVKYTGLKFFQNDMRDAIQSDMKRIHIFVTPISLLVLIVVLGCNFYVALIPIVSVATTVFLWSIVMYVVALYLMQITQFTPTIMMTLTVGLGIDYTLFLLSRYLSFKTDGGGDEDDEDEDGEQRESEQGVDRSDGNVDATLSSTSVPLSSPDDNENKNNTAAENENNEEEEEEDNQGQPNNSSTNNSNNNNQSNQHYNNEAIQIMLSAAGHTILISGITLMCCFLGLLFLPLVFFQSMAVGCSITIVSTLIVNLTVVPALLHTRLGVKMRLWAMKRRGRQMGIAGAWEDMRRLGGWMFGKCGDWCSRCCNKCRRGGADDSNEEPSEEEPSQEEGDVVEKEAMITRTSTIATIANSSSSESSTNIDDQSSDLLEPLLPAPSSSQMLSSNESDARPSSAATSTPTTTMEGLNNADSNTNASTANKQYKSFWYELADHLLNTKHSIIILLVVLAVMVPIGCFSGQITSSISFELVLPQKTSLALRAYHLLGDRFGVGVLCPYRILFDGVGEHDKHSSALTLSNDLVLNYEKKRVFGKSVQTAEAFEVMYKLINNLLVNEQRKNEHKNATITCGHVGPLPNATINTSHPLIQTELQENMMKMIDLIQDHQEVISATASAAVVSEDGHVMEGKGSFEKQWKPLFQQLAAMEMKTNGQDKREPLSIQEDEITPTFSSLLSPEPATSTSNITRYEGIAIVNNMHIPYVVFEAAVICDAFFRGHCPVKLFHTLAYVDRTITSKDQKTTFLNAILPEDPFSRQGIDWLLMARETIQCLEENGDLKGYSVYIDGIVAITYDAVENVYKAFPRMIVITLVVVFVLMGLFFRSVITPFRSAATIALTASFVFGLAVLAFQKGDVDWVGIPGIHYTGEISFIAPAMSFSIIVGLGLDYDVFLISRILEFRLGGGHTHRSSITEGLAATGGIITAAGLIMAVAFGSLLFSSTPALVQWSFILTVGVLVDTFVIRTMVVPILMGYTGKYSWWPQKMPDDTVNEGIAGSGNTEPLLEGENSINGQEDEEIVG